jgi:uncharacterized membrane protein YphA (DoxX/SURF4 family)
LLTRCRQVFKLAERISRASFFRVFAVPIQRRSLVRMQRLFSMFPSGPPGVALILLRISVAATIILHGFTRREEWAAAALLALLLFALALIAGFLTPIFALAAMAIQLIGPASTSTLDIAFIILAMTNALMLALLGPGAYSVDAVRFGRRVVELPDNDSGRR